MDPQKKIQVLDKETDQVSLEQKSSQRALDFVSIGVGCFAFSLLGSSGVLASFVDNGYFSEKSLEKNKKIKNKIAIESALTSLCLCGVLVKNKENYFLTELGRQLAQHIGLVSMVFEGYGCLMSVGAKVAFGRLKNARKYMDKKSIAMSSVQFGEKIDPIISKTIKNLNVQGTICDLGCGSGERLDKICTETKLPGLGIDISIEAVKLARKLTAGHSNVTIEQANAEKLDGIWEDVQVLMQCFMTHDIFPDDSFIDSLSSYRKNFPNLKYFLIVDITAPEETFFSHMPAYELVHGLQGIRTRRYKEFVKLFHKSGYTISKEISLDMPNTYLWVLRPSS